MVKQSDHKPQDKAYGTRTEFGGCFTITIYFYDIDSVFEPNLQCSLHCHFKVMSVLWQNQFELYQFECPKHLNAPQPSLVCRVTSRWYHLISDHNTSIHPARRQVRDTTFHNILHHIAYKICYIRVLKLVYRSSDLYKRVRSKLSLLQEFCSEKKTRLYIHRNGCPIKPKQDIIRLSYHRSWMVSTP